MGIFIDILQCGNDIHSEFLPEVFPNSEIIRLIVLLLSCLFIEGHSASLNVISLFSYFMSKRLCISRKGYREMCLNAN